MINSRLINTKVAGGGGCTDIVDAYDPFSDSSGLALYQLNGNANDVSGNYNGTWGGTEAYTTGVFGQAANFNGGSYISTNGNISGGQDFTISLWCYLNTSSAQESLFTMGSATNNGFFIYRSGQQLALDSFGFTRYNNNTFFTENTWQHLVITYSSGTNNIYLDGSFVDTFSYTWNINASATTYIGAQIAGYSRYLNGKLDQVRIFNTALDPLEIEALYTEELCICDGTVDTLDILGDGSCIATYTLDGNANDLSGNYSGTPTDVSYGVGEFDLAGVFNGSTSKIELPLTTLGSSSFSISMWIKFNSVGSGSTQQYLFTKYKNSASGTYGMLCQKAANQDTINFIAYNTSNGTYGTVNTTTAMTAGVWYNYVLVFNSGSAITAYLNSSSEATTGTSGTFGQNTAEVTVGAYWAGATYLDGSIDQVRIFNKALNSTEVTTLYNETACTKITREAGVTQILGDSSCIAYYKLDGTADDETGTYNGTFTNPNYGNGEFDLAGSFNGSSSFISLGTLFNTNVYSFSFWVNPTTTTPSALEELISSSSPRLGYFQGTSGELVIYDGSQYRTSVDNMFVGGSWVHVCIVANSTTLNVYKNGVNVNTQTITGNNVNNLFISKHPTASLNYFDGLIDQVRIFNKAVSASEVTTLYNEGL